MSRPYRTSGRHINIMINAAKLVFFAQPHKTTFATPSHKIHFPPSPNLRRLSGSGGSLGTMNANNDPQLEKIFEEKRSLRSRIRRELKKIDPIQRSQEDEAIQNVVLEAPWFKTSRSICAYISSDALREVDTSKIVSEIISNPSTESHIQISKKLYVPRVEDKNSNMRMLRISSLDDLVASSMNLLEPTLIDCNGNPREDVMEATDPVDLIILPGLAFDRCGRRLGRSGGYYDLFLKKYQELVKKQNWKPPLHVALSYSVQIVENERIPVTPFDVPVDALISPSGFIPISSAASRICR
ncbi:hypothetical protein L6164_027176 [Bauhinia variegata]|uniref:Uncharacterized protein n=1 Tax=Bauhinia variegata TaxID=167791 RepID=A0ACB9LSL1_BAUVA|nr:hypothetical protein L6164_027176 [Bauhinia variegata]